MNERHCYSRLFVCKDTGIRGDGIGNKYSNRVMGDDLDESFKFSMLRPTRTCICIRSSRTFSTSKMCCLVDHKIYPKFTHISHDEYQTDIVLKEGQFL